MAFARSALLYYCTEPMSRLRIEPVPVPSCGFAFVGSRAVVAKLSAHSLETLSKEQS